MSINEFEEHINNSYYLEFISLYDLLLSYGPSWDQSAGCPNFGPPHGWGLMQLDLLDGGERPTAQELWSWKANIDRGYRFLNGEKRIMVNNRFNLAAGILETWYEEKPDEIIEGHESQIEGRITYSHASSPYFNINFGNNLPDQHRSFADATWIKNYNGSSGGTDGYPGYYYILKQLSNVNGKKPFWEIQRTNNNGHNYVEAVSNRAE